MRRPSIAHFISLLSLAVAVAALVVALRNDGTAPPRPAERTRPTGLWRALPADADLPDGWRVTYASVHAFDPAVSAQLDGPDQSSAHLVLARHEEGDIGAHLDLRDVRESADALPGHEREQVGRLGNEAVAIRQVQRLAGADGPHVETVSVFWRRGDVVAHLWVQRHPTFLGPGRSEPAKPIETGAVEALARAIDARLERELR